MATHSENVQPAAAAPVKPVQVKKSMYTGLKSKITINLKTMERYFKDFADNQIEVQSGEEKQNLYAPLKNCEDALNQWDQYIIQHSAHEDKKKESDPEYVDADLEVQRADRDKYDEKYGMAVVKANRLCSAYNLEKDSRQRRPSQSAPPTSPRATQPQQQTIVIREDKTNINDSIKPDRLNHNASMFAFLNWIRAVEAYFTINKMHEKDQKIQVATLYSCLDDTLRRMLTVHYASLPDVPVISDEPDSYQNVLIDYFNDKYPMPIRVNDFFMQTQRPNESVNDFAQRCEALAIAGNIKDFTYDDWVKYKITTGLIHSQVLRSKLLRKLTDPDFDSLKLKREIAEFEASEKVSTAIDKMAAASVNQINQVSTYKRQQTEAKLDGYRQRGPPPFQVRTQRPFAPKQPFPRYGQSAYRQQQPRPNVPNGCYTCGFVPYFRCTQHFGKPQNRGQGRPFQGQRRHNAIQDVPHDNPEENDDNFVNTISTVLMALDDDVQNITHAREFVRDENGLPIMPNQRQTPLIYAFICHDLRNYPDPADRSIYYQIETPITEVLCLPDTGAVQSVCHPDLARQCSLPINRNDNIDMYAANGQRLNCLGSVKARISYFGYHLPLKMYVMADVARDYIVIDYTICRYLKIIPPRFPLPIDNCDYTEYPHPLVGDPFFGGGLSNVDGNHTPHRPMSPPDPYAVHVMSGDAGKEEKARHIPEAVGKCVEKDVEAKPENVQENSKIRVSCSFRIESEKAPALVKINKLVQEYLDVFNTLLRKDITVPPVRFHFKKNVQVVPYKCTSAKPVPFALMDAAKREIQHQIDLGIIDRVPPDVPLDWICPAMMLEKGNSRDCRLVASAVRLNEFLDRDAFPQQSAKELVTQIPPSSKYFLTVDFFKGFYQIPLHQDDQLKTTFMLHGFGLYFFKKLPQGTTCSVDIFNRITDELVHDIPNCLKMVDDIMFHGATIDEVLQHFTILLKRCREKGFTLHPEKLAFGNRLKFAGYVVSDKGLEIDPKKVEAIRKFPKPVSVQDMKSFVGLAQQFQQACPFLMGTLKPLIDTTSHKVTPAVDEKNRKIKNHKRIIFWTQPLEEAFLKAKQLLTNADGTVLAAYDPKLPLTIYTDASRLEGFGWLAVQEIDGANRLIECGSSTIPESARRNFSVCELELACVEMAMRKMRMLTVGNENVTVKTDHQAIIGVLAKPLEKIETRRLMKLAEKLQQYRFRVSYISGVRNEVADALSRHPVSNQDESEIDTSNLLMINQMSIFDNQANMDIEQIRFLADKDEDYALIRDAIVNGILARNLPPDHPARPYKPDWHLLGTNGNLITFGERILIPKAARKEILKMLHFAHLGRQKTCALASHLYYWKGMNKEVCQMVESCEKCQIHSNFPQKEPLKQTFASFPMEMNSVDLAEHNRKSYLIHADRYSGFLWIYPLKKTTSQDVKQVLWQTFSQFGFPKHLRSDNGPQFVSDFFISECKKAGIEQEWSSPLWPIGNGHGERSVGLGKALIKKAEHPEDLQQMLTIFNATPNVSKLSPHELLQRRKLRTPLPSLGLSAGIVSENDIAVAEEIKKKLAEDKKKHYDKSARELPRLRINQKVRVYNNKTNRWDISGHIVNLDEKCGRSYRILTNNDVYLWRNRRYLTPIVNR